MGLCLVVGKKNVPTPTPSSVKLYFVILKKKEAKFALCSLVIHISELDKISSSKITEVENQSRKIVNTRSWSRQI